jgi:hypothetical protein
MKFDEDKQRRREILLTALDEQLSSPETPEVRSELERLIALGLPAAEARRMMARVLAMYVWHTMRKDPYTYEDYLMDLSTLPESERKECQNVLPPKDSFPATTEELIEDPFYDALLDHIESRILASDRDARSREVTLNDSQIRSIINKVRKKAEGGAPKLPVDSMREKILAALYEELVLVRTVLQEELPDGSRVDLSTRDWLLALRAVEDSVRLHSVGAGSRAYLEYLEAFFDENADEEDFLEGD